MGEGMGNCAINSQLGSNSDSHHHKSDLVDLAVTQYPTKIIFNHRVKDRKHRHYPAYGNQYFSTGKQAGKHTNRTLSCKSTQPNWTGMGSLGISILEPSVQTWEGRFDSNCKQYQHGPGVSRFQGIG